MSKIVVVLVAMAALVGAFLLLTTGIPGISGFGKNKPAPVTLTDLRAGATYQVAFTRLVDAELPDGSVIRSREFHFSDHTVRSQAIPLRDGRGRVVVRRLNDPKLPVGTMRLVRIVEADPEFEGLKFGDYHWEGLRVEFNLPLSPQKVIPRVKVRG